MAVFSRHSSRDADAKVKEIYARLDEAKKDLEILHITRLVETITKLQDLLGLCKNSKKGKDTIQKFTNLATTLIDDILDPLLKEKKLGEVEISEALTYHIEAFLSELSHALPVPPRSFLSRLFRGNVIGTLTQANLVIEGGLQKFQSKGTIKCEVRAQDNRRILDIDQNSPHTGGEQELSGPSLAVQTGPNVLEPTVDGTPRIRILLLGKSGVGKSSLINNIFRDSCADVAQFREGTADINHEITSNTNPHFIFHDSKGYEAGTIDQFNTVQDFIVDRSRRSEISEQIHAIWLCTTSPMSGGRVFEVGDERFFEMGLGKVPLIVVFTKYDELVAGITKKTCIAEGMDDETKLRVAVGAEAEVQFKSSCIQPLEHTTSKIAGRTDLPPFIRVSVNPTYETTISDLIQLTRRKVDATAISQRATPDTSVQASN